MKPREEKPSEFDVFEILSWIGAACVVIGGSVAAAYSVFQTQSQAASTEALAIAREAVISARQDRMGTFVREGFDRIDGKLDKLNEKIDAVLLYQKKAH